jgi:hypothetical protein
VCCFSTLKMKAAFRENLQVKTWQCPGTRAPPRSEKNNVLCRDMKDYYG